MLGAPLRLFTKKELLLGGVGQGGETGVLVLLQHSTGLGVQMLNLSCSS